MKSYNSSGLGRTESMPAIEQLEDRRLLSAAPLMSGTTVAGGLIQPAVRATHAVHNVNVVGTFTGTLHLDHAVPALGAVHKASVTVTASTQSSDGQVSGSVALGQLGTFTFTGTVHGHTVAFLFDAASGASGKMTGSVSGTGKAIGLRLNSLVNGQRVDGTLHASMSVTRPAVTSSANGGGGHHVTHVVAHSPTSGSSLTQGTMHTTGMGTGHSGTTTNNGSGMMFAGPGSPTSGPGSASSGPGSATSGPGSATSGPGSPTTGPGSATAGPGSPTGGPGSATSGPGSPTGGPGTMNGGVTPMGSFVQPAVNLAMPAFGTSFVQPNVVSSMGSGMMMGMAMPVTAGVFGSTTIM
jgi:hypothetical protein